MPTTFDDDDWMREFNHAGHHQQSATGTITDIAKHVQALFSSPALMYHLWIKPSDPQITATIRKMFRQDIDASATVLEGSGQEQMLLNFLSRRGLKIPKQTPPPKTFFPDLPVYSICRILPLPDDSTEISQLLAELFRHVGLTEETKITYDHQIVSTSPPPPIE